MIVDERCVMCESGAEENVEHLLVTCIFLSGVGGNWQMQ